jgi:hypothetical protein
VADNVSTGPRDAFTDHIENLLVQFADGKLSGGVMGNGALRILSLQNQYSESECAVDEQLTFYSSLITPHKGTDSQTLIFPSTLNSHQRLTIHTLAEKINAIENRTEQSKAFLTHESVGEGDKRRIEVRLKLSSTADFSPLAESLKDETPLESCNLFENIAAEELSHSELPRPLTPTEPESPPSSVKKPPPIQKLKKQPKKEKEDKVLIGIKAGLTEDELIAEAIRENAVSAHRPRPLN